MECQGIEQKTSAVLAIHGSVVPRRQIPLAALLTTSTPPAEEPTPSYESFPGAETFAGSPAGDPQRDSAGELPDNMFKVITYPRSKVSRR